MPLPPPSPVPPLQGVKRIKCMGPKHHLLIEMVKDMKDEDLKRCGCEVGMRLVEYIATLPKHPEAQARVCPKAVMLTEDGGFQVRSETVHCVLSR